VRLPHNAAAAVVAALLVIAAPASAQAPPPAAPEIASAIDAVKADPNLATERTIKALRWRGSDAPATPPGRLAWLADLFRWIDQSARMMVWVAVIAGGGGLAAFLVHMLRGRTGGGRLDAFTPPTHVGDLDIRPESLPDDVGAAARALWDRGDHRAALSLLYRGLLSRLVHVHGVPIRDSSTEGDCLALASGHITPDARLYAGGLVALWQRAVYGREDVATLAVHGLCDDFNRALAPSPAPLGDAA
jgi:hypothetical protein